MSSPDTLPPDDLSQDDASSSGLSPSGFTVSNNSSSTSTNNVQPQQRSTVTFAPTSTVTSFNISSSTSTPAQSIAIIPLSNPRMEPDPSEEFANSMPFPYVYFVKNEILSGRSNFLISLYIVKELKNYIIVVLNDLIFPYLHIHLSFLL